MRLGMYDRSKVNSFISLVHVGGWIRINLGAFSYIQAWHVAHY